MKKNKGKIGHAIDGFSSAIRVRNVKQIMAYIDRGRNINTDCGVRVFDALLSLPPKKAEESINHVLSNPNWNPNYRSADMWHPEEHAMIHHREDVAIRIVQHPNFDKRELPRVVRSARMFKANKVLAFLGERVHD